MLGALSRSSTSALTTVVGVDAEKPGSAARELVTTISSSIGGCAGVVSRRLPACAEACPTGARVFGNLLDPNSEIRWVLANKQVFRLKEELATEPRFWYFSD